MNNLNERQHYVSKVLLKRFKAEGSPLYCYQVNTGEWKPRSVDNICSAEGYNQLLIPGESDNDLEAAFSKVESKLRETFRLLEQAANKKLTELPANTYQNMCLYCAFLKLSSLFAKASGVALFVTHLNWELEHCRYDLLKELNCSEQELSTFREAYLRGGRVIIESDNVLQSVYRFQFSRTLQHTYTDFLWSDWTISRSPIELPMSDIGLVPIHLEQLRANQFFLPIGPELLLEGLFYFDNAKNSLAPPIKGHVLIPEEAEYRLDTICGSAVSELICSRKIPDISVSRNRAKSMGVKFHQIVNPRLLDSAGLATCSSQICLRVVSMPEYVKFVHSFILPPDYETTL